MSRLLQEKRKTRGLRMADLVGKAVDEDEQFWNSDIWRDDESDDSFSEEEVKPDVFDDDFNDSEDDDDEDDDDSNDNRKSINDTNKKSSNRYKEPVKRVDVRVVQQKAVFNENITQAKKSRVSSESSVREKNRSNNENSAIALGAAERKIRDSTKVQSQFIDNKLKNLTAITYQKKNEKEGSGSEATFHQFTQKELLIDALETEKLNKTWIESQKFQLDESLSTSGEDAFKALSGQSSEIGMIRKLSRRGTYNTITFTDDNLIPSFLRKNIIIRPIVPNKTCIITGLDAKYRDPLTGYPYANLTAFKEIRRRYSSDVSKKK